MCWAKCSSRVRYCYEPAFDCEGNGITAGQGRAPLTRATQCLAKWHDLAGGAGCLVRVAALYWVSPLFLPAPQQVLHQLIIIASPQGFMNATLWQHLVASLGRMAALLAAVIIGIPVGFAMGLNDTVRGILDPLIEIYCPMPPLAYLPLMAI